MDVQQDMLAGVRMSHHLSMHEPRDARGALSVTDCRANAEAHTCCVTSNSSCAGGQAGGRRVVSSHVLLQAARRCPGPKVGVPEALQQGVTGPTCRGLGGRGGKEEEGTEAGHEVGGRHMEKIRL